MTRQKAKTILSVYRPDLSPAEVPELPEALRLLEGDESLAQWFWSERRFDDAFSAAIREIPVPEGLAEEILGGTPVVQARVERFPRRRFWQGAAAMVALLVGGWLMKPWVFPSKPRFPAGDFTSLSKFGDDMAGFARGSFALAKQTGDFAAIRAWLADRASPGFSRTPSVMAGRKGLGCRTLEWGDHRVSVICFEIAEGKVVHLFIVDQEPFRGGSPSPEPGAIAVRHGLETVGWLEQNKWFLLVGGQPEVSLEGLVSSEGRA